MLPSTSALLQAHSVQKIDMGTALLKLPSAMDAVAEIELTLRRVPLAAFNASLTDGSASMRAVLDDIVRAQRQQTDLAVSRLAKDAEARCAVLKAAIKACVRCSCSSTSG
jgi:hypothetical protein